MDFTLTPDQQAYVEAASAFAEEALKPHAARWDKEHEFPIPTIKQAAALGFAASTPRSSTAASACRGSMPASSSSASRWAAPPPPPI